MPLNDAEAAKIGRWKQTNEEAIHRVCTGLRSFVLSGRARFPDAAELVTCCRDALYAYFQGAQRFLFDQLDLALAAYRERLFALSPESYLSLICALHMQHLVLVQVGKNRPANEEGWFALLTEGVGEIYGRPSAYVNEWRDRLDWFSDADHGPARIVVKAYDEIAPIVGSPPPYRIPVLERLFWSDIELSIAERAKAIYCDGKWRELVDAQLAARRIAD